MRILLTLPVLFLLAACVERPTEPIDVEPAFARSDGVQNANPHFFWLPPMGGNPTFSGVFDGSLEPVVEICEWTGEACEAPLVARFTTGEASGSETVRVFEDHYEVNWHTRRSVLDESTTYRIRVLVAGTELGFADVDVVNDGSQLGSVDTERFVPLRNGSTLPIKFRIEQGGVYLVDQVGGRISAEGGSVVLDVPEGALQGQAGITVWAVAGYSEPIPGTAFAFGPDGTAFDPPAILTIAYDPQDLPGNVNESLLGLHKLVGGSWVRVPGTTVDTDANAVTGEIHGFSYYGVLESVSGMLPTSITFASDQSSGDYEIYLFGPGDANPVALTNEQGWDLMPDWRGGGELLAFVRSGAIHTMNADGSGVTQITAGYSAWQPDWSPNGDRIAFMVADGPQLADIYVMDLVVGGVTQLTFDPAVEQAPKWSPDGQKILFQRQHTEGGHTSSDVFVMNADGSGVQNLTNHSAYDGVGSWSPGCGDRIAFFSDRSGNGDIYVMNADGSAVTQVTGGPDIDSNPAWSPDGEWIVYETEPSDPRTWKSDLWMVSPDGGGGVPVVWGSGDESGPDWKTPLWRIHCSRATTSLNDVWGTSLSDLIAVADAGTILTYDGVSWAARSIDPQYRAIRSVWGSSPTEVFAAGEGVLWHYDGSEWTSYETPRATSYNDVWGTANDDVFAVGGGYLSHFDGVAWNEQPAPIDDDYVAVTGEVAPQRVYAVGRHGTVLAYQGGSWFDFSLWEWWDPLWRVHGAWADGDFSFYAAGESIRTGGGIVLHFEPFIGWEEVAQSPKRLYGIWGSSPTNVFAVGELGAILHFDGSSWTEMPSGTDETLYGVWGTSANDVFVVGANGTILQHDGTGLN